MGAQGGRPAPAIRTPPRATETVLATRLISSYARVTGESLYTVG
jgi:hypothetical protein